MRFLALGDDIAAYSVDVRIKSMAGKMGAIGERSDFNSGWTMVCLLPHRGGLVEVSLRENRVKAGDETCGCAAGALEDSGIKPKHARGKALGGRGFEVRPTNRFGVGRGTCRVSEASEQTCFPRVPDKIFLKSSRNWRRANGAAERHRWCLTTSRICQNCGVQVVWRNSGLRGRAANEGVSDGGNIGAGVLAMTERSGFCRPGARRKVPIS